VFDDLQNSTASPFLEEELPSINKEVRSRRRGSGGGPGFLGMTAGQRFVIALLLLFMVCAMGSFCLILTGKVVIPFI
jgi:hypothetical protein